MKARGKRTHISSRAIGPEDRLLKKEDLLGVWDVFGSIDAKVKPFYGIFWHGMRFVSRWKWITPSLYPMNLEPLGKPENGVSFFRQYIPFASSSGEEAEGAVSFYLERVLFPDGMRERFSVSNFGRVRRAFNLVLFIDADFADMFEVRGFVSSVAPHRKVKRVFCDGVLRISCMGEDDLLRESVISFAGMTPSNISKSGKELHWSIDLPPGEECFIEPVVALSESVSGASPLLNVHHSSLASFPSVLKEMRNQNQDDQKKWPVLKTDHPVLSDAYDRACQDLDMLFTGPPGGKVPYAGLPWFSTFFGRDAIITAYSMLWARPDIALNVLRYLEKRQATDITPFRAAQPGKILHEERSGELSNLGEVPFGQYYGSIDSTPLYIVLACEYYQRTGDDHVMRSLWPSILKALAWIDQYGLHPDSRFLVYQRDPEGGLVNQGWKDSADSVFHADGSIARHPIALIGVQGYLYWAWSMLAPLAERFGDPSLGIILKTRAGELKDNIIKKFWLDEQNIFAMAIDGDGKPCAIASSNPGHLLLTGLLPEELARKLAVTLLGPDMFSGWGIRTVGKKEARYNPVSYHNGSIWPHDNGLILAGLSRSGFLMELGKLSKAYLDGVSMFRDYRLPELICGFDREESSGPVLYPTSCSPQTWSVASLFLLIRSMTGEIFDKGKFIHDGSFFLPPGIGSLEILGLNGDDIVLKSSGHAH